jgi:hypothetical protein
MINFYDLHKQELDLNNEYREDVYNIRHMDSLYDYSKVLHIIRRDIRSAVLYAQYVKQGRYLDAEQTIMTSPMYAYLYALKIIKDRWPEAESYIMKDPKWAYRYAVDVIEGRWYGAERHIILSPQIWPLYSGFLRDKNY